jgi:hypothetical protein
VFQWLQWRAGQLSDDELATHLMEMEAGRAAADRPPPVAPSPQVRAPQPRSAAQPSGQPAGAARV